MRDFERLLRLDELMRSHIRHTADSLADILERTERTIRDDIAYLRDRLGAPIEYDRKLGWHYTDPAWSLPAMPLSQGEVFALTLGARMLTAYSGSAFGPQLKSAVEQLAKRLPEQSWVDLQQLANEYVMFRLGAELDLDPDIWQGLEQACQQKRRVQMTYATPGKPLSERQFDPYVLHFSRNNPYVTGWCHLRQEVRWFRIDRIRSLALLGETFEIDPTFDKADHFAAAFQHEVGGIPQEMVIWFDGPTAPYIRERRWHPTQQIEEHGDGSLTLRFVVRGVAEVKRWVMYYGAGAKALGPPELVAMVRQEIEGMQRHYSQEVR